MFGTTPPTSSVALTPEPTPQQLRAYAQAVSRQVETIAKATRLAHTAYRKREKKDLPRDAATEALTPGRLAIVCRPSTNKLFTRNAGPFLVVSLTGPHVTLHSLTTGVQFRENVKNVRAIQVAGG